MNTAMIDDAQLLRSYAETRSEAAFAELVRRQVNFVHSAALRQVNGDAHLAQDVTQLVFTDLARKAGELANHRVLAGWLFTSTRFAAAKLVRGERRRQAREAEAPIMNEINGDPTEKMDWERVRPVLDATLAELGEADREAILLRFFEGREFAEVGARLRLSDNAARMRVERALGKLHARLMRRGVTSTTAALAVALGGHAVAAAPAGLAAAVTGVALAGGSAVAAGAAAGGAWMTFMSMTKLQIGISSALAVAGATGFVLQAQTNAALRDEVAALQRDNGRIAALRAENLRLARTAAEAGELRGQAGGEDAELKRLHDEAAALAPRLQAVTRAEAAALAARGEAGKMDPSKWDRLPVPKQQVRPKYPAAARAAGVSGEVLVDFIVDAEGNVRNAFVAKAGEGEARPSVKLVNFVVAAAGADGAVGAAGVGAGRSEAEAKAMAEEFGAAAVAAVSQWKFEPGTKGGRKVNTVQRVPIVFTVNEDGDAAAKGGR